MTPSPSTLPTPDSLISDANTPEPMHSLNHSYICMKILRQLFQNDAVEAYPELTLDIGKGLTPDISVYPAAQLQPNLLHDRSKVDQLPLLAIEVISASQNIQDLLEKAQQLVQAGVAVVWTIEPYGQSIFVTTAAGNHLFHREIITSEQISVDFTQIFPEV